MEILTDGIDPNKSVFECSQCRLYWFKVKDDLLEFRIAVFSPIVPKDCPFCKGINKHPPTEQFLDLQKVGRKELSFEEYLEKYPQD